jgi:hypothetical protein
MVTPEKIIIRRPQSSLTARFVALRKQIIDLHRIGKIITQEQKQLRKFLKAWKIKFL